MSSNRDRFSSNFFSLFRLADEVLHRLDSERKNGPKLKPRWDVHLSGDDDLSWVKPVNPSHPYLENDPAPSFDPHHLRISPWL